MNTSHVLIPSAKGPDFYGNFARVNTALTPADVLEKAADLIENVGWHQGNFDVRSLDGAALGFCAAGACTYALTQNARFLPPEVKDVHDAAAKALSAEVLKVAPFTKGSIPRWNDHSGRTKEQVIDLLRHTAKELRNNATPE